MDSNNRNRSYARKERWVGVDQEIRNTASEIYKIRHLVSAPPCASVAFPVQSRRPRSADRNCVRGAQQMIKFHREYCFTTA